MSKLQIALDEREYVDSIYASEQDTHSIHSSEEEKSDDSFSLSYFLDIEKILLDTFHSLQDFFKGEALEIGTMCKYPDFAEWIEEYVYVPKEFEDDESEENASDIDM